MCSCARAGNLWQGAAGVKGWGGGVVECAARSKAANGGRRANAAPLRRRRFRDHRAGASRRGDGRGVARLHHDGGSPRAHPAPRANSRADTDGDGDTCAHGNARPDADAYAYTDTDVDAYPHPHADTDA